MTNNQLTDERLVKILSETQAAISEHNCRQVRGCVEVDAPLARLTQNAPPNCVFMAGTYHVTANTLSRRGIRSRKNGGID